MRGKITKAFLVITIFFYAVELFAQVDTAWVRNCRGLGNNSNVPLEIGSQHCGKLHSIVKGQSNETGASCAATNQISNCSWLFARRHDDFVDGDVASRTLVSDSTQMPWTRKNSSEANANKEFDDTIGGGIRLKETIRSEPPEGLPQKGPYLSSVTQNSIIISWRTTALDSSNVQYGLTTEYGSEAKDATLKTTHSLTLIGLLPDTIYHYRVRFGGKQTPDYTFRTAVHFNNTFRFSAYGDTRTQADSHLAVVNRIVAFDPYFILHTGDLVANGFDENQWTIYFATICSSSTCAQKIPYYYSIGNHEGENPLYYAYFPLPHNNPESTESYYSFDYGNSHFISLDAQIPYGPTSAQYQWLKTDLLHTCDKTFVFVFMHDHPYCAGGHNSNVGLRDILCPLFEEYRVDLVLSGHSHFYQRNGPINGVTYLITAGGGAPLYDPAESSWTKYTEKNHHFVHFMIWPDSFMLKMVRTDGTVGDSLVCYAHRKPPLVSGDVNSDEKINLADVIYMVNHVFDKPASACRSGCWPIGPGCIGDVTGDGIITISDVIYLVNYDFDMDRPATRCLGSSPGNCWTPVPSGACCLPVP